MQSTGDIAAFRIGRCVPNKLKEREALPSNLRLQEPSYLGNEQQMYGAYHVAEALYLALRKESRTFLKVSGIVCVWIAFRFFLVRPAYVMYFLSAEDTAALDWNPP